MNWVPHMSGLGQLSRSSTSTLGLEIFPIYFSMPHPFHCISVDPQGSTLYAGTAQTLQAIDLQSGTVVKTLDLDSLASTNRTQSKPTNEIRAEIQTLAMTRDGESLIATTNEDKSAIVYSSRLESQISRHTFPKRPSAVDTTYDGQTLILADKFGDVYAVPLNESSDLSSDKDSAKPILGHVSMLVDLVVVKDEDGKQFIITADRDEHIRVSRYPQSYVIERWLFAHHEFVSQLCILPWAPNVLLSGGGDDFLCVWKWSTGELLQKINLSSVIHETPTPTPDPQGITAEQSGPSDPVEVALSYVIPVPSLKTVLLFCEGTSKILHFKTSEDNSTLLRLQGVTDLPHTALSIAVDSNNLLYVSYHHSSELVGIFDLKNGKGPATPTKQELCREISSKAAIPDEQGRPVTLFTIRTLRKRKANKSNE